MYDCLGEGAMHRPAPEERQGRQKKEGDICDERDVNVDKICGGREERGA